MCHSATDCSYIKQTNIMSTSFNLSSVWWNYFYLGRYCECAHMTTAEMCREIP